MGKILLVEDEESIRSFIVLNLKRLGFEVLEAESGEVALRLFTEEPRIEVALLDVMLPGMDGFEVCARLRKQNESIGIIMLTAKGQEMDRVQGLSIGADDYIVKPFSTSELIARIEALLRRVRLLQKEENQERLASGPFILDKKMKLLKKHGLVLDLTPVEWTLVQCLIEHSDQVLSRDELLDQVWGINYVGDPKVVDVNVRRLRQKIEDDPAHPRYLLTSWGNGYIWKGIEG